MNALARAPITTHILDTERGKPAVGVSVELSQLHQGSWTVVNQGQTNSDGRVEQWQQPLTLATGMYQLVFATDAYFKQLGVASFYPEVNIRFYVAEPQEHYHVPLLLSAHGYSTYRGT